MSVIGKCLTAKRLLLIMNRVMSLQSTPPVLLPLKAEGLCLWCPSGCFRQMEFQLFSTQAKSFSVLFAIRYSLRENVNRQALTN